MDFKEVTTRDLSLLVEGNPDPVIVPDPGFQGEWCGATWGRPSREVGQAVAWNSSLLDEFTEGTGQGSPNLSPDGVVARRHANNRFHLRFGHAQANPLVDADGERRARPERIPPQ